MAKSAKHLTSNLPYLHLPAKMHTPAEASLFLARMKELDREFARQTKQLAALTKHLSHKAAKRLLPPHK